MSGRNFAVAAVRTMTGSAKQSRTSAPSQVSPRAPSLSPAQQLGQPGFFGRREIGSLLRLPSAGAASPDHNHNRHDPDQATRPAARPTGRALCQASAAAAAQIRRNGRRENPAPACRCRRPSAGRAPARANRAQAAPRNRRSTGSGTPCSAIPSTACARALRASGRQASRWAQPRAAATPPTTTKRAPQNRRSQDSACCTGNLPPHSLRRLQRRPRLRGRGAPMRKRRSDSDRPPPTNMIRAPSQIIRTCGLK